MTFSQAAVWKPAALASFVTIVRLAWCGTLGDLLATIEDLIVREGAEVRIVQRDV
jgi:hypothetical protein